MKKGILFFQKSTLGNGPTAFDWWKATAAGHGIELQIAFFEDVLLGYDKNGRGELINGENTDYVDFAVMRGYDKHVSMHYETVGVKVFNRWFPMEMSRNKLLTHQCLTAAGIPMPTTYYASKAITYADACDCLESGTFVVKAIVGSCGRNVYLVHNEDEYESAVDACGRACILQEFIKESTGRDIRVWTIGGQAVACVMRKSDKSFRSNFSCGGVPVQYKLTHEISALAIRASRQIGLDFAGVDILLGKDGPIVCEINGNAGFRTLSAVGGPDILECFFKFLDRKVYGK